MTGESANEEEKRMIEGYGQAKTLILRMRADTGELTRRS
jgi:hypothetical protein